jgi:hypothetical protein
MVMLGFGFAKLILVPASAVLLGVACIRGERVVVVVAGFACLVGESIVNVATI